MAGSEHQGSEAASGFAEDTLEELLEQAHANAQATIIATAAFLDEHGVPIEAWTEALGRTFALAWDEPSPWEAGEFLDALLTNYRSLGATIVSAELAADQAAATITGFPDPALCAVFGVDPALAARFNDVPAVLARDRGLGWRWRRDGETTHLVAERRGEGATPRG